ncbi:MAG TPA: aminotransferase class I/II-fold pyridoxal phosphate-dependent enzyme, partial [Acidimicrobiales bacterium]|nr:aminotransferase class I/II-fold pyridoxal phosphate-dependent enzyme [Acidimicrobiales bacterium]
MADRIAPRDDIAMMDGYHSPQVSVDVRLNTNESPLAPPSEFVEAFAARVADVDWNRYPDRAATELRSRLADLHGVTADRVFVANGSNEVLQTVSLTFGGPGRSVAVFEPTYAMHSQIARVTGATVAVGSRADDLALDLDEVRRIIDEWHPAITYLCSPNNPTGLVETRETVLEVLELVEAIGGLLVVDEAYGQFAPWSALELISDDRSLVVTRTYSKTWSMAALRLGYLVGPAWVVDELEKVVLPYHLDVLSQLAGTMALDHVDAMEQRVSILTEERGRLEAALRDLPLEVWPSAANFILFRPTTADAD